MGKKVKKKAQSGHKGKRVATASPNTDSQQCTEAVVVKERNICPHLVNGIDLDKLSTKLGSQEPVKCEDCREDVNDRRAGKGRSNHVKKKGGSSVDSKMGSKAMWVCLECGHFSCGGAGLPTTPQSHAVRHAKQSRHHLAVQFKNPNLRWCFPCQILIPLQNLEENGEQKDLLPEIVKLIKARPSEVATGDVEDVWFGSGSVLSETKSENTISNYINGRGGYAVRGLINLGNTCFFNSIMQNLLAMDKVRDYFLNLDVSVGPLAVSLKKLFVETSPEGGLRNAVNPKSFFGCVCAKAPQFRGYQQHDSHELLRCLLDALCIEELSARKQIKASEENGISPNQSPTFVDAIFGGQLSSTVSCLKCGHSSIVYEPFLDLSLPVPTKKSPPKKVSAVSRAKKPKLPPKRSGRVRPKVNREADPLPAQSVTDKTAASSGDSTPLESIDQSTQNLSAAQPFENKQSFENVTEDTASENSAWLDYLDLGRELNDYDTGSQINDISVTQDTANKDAVQNNLLSQNTLESNRLSLVPSESTWFDYPEPNKLSDDHNLAQNGILLEHSSESGSQVFSKESTRKMEDEPPLQVQDSEILLLPYKDDTVGCEENTADFDGFGDMFNEPEIVYGPSVKPISSGNVSGANDVAETGFAVGNSSGSDPDEVDNSDSPVSVETCLFYFTKPELLSKNEHAWHCENCSKSLRLQMMRSRNKLEKPTSNIPVNGVTNLSNGNIKFGSSDQSLVETNGTNGKTDGNLKCMLELSQKADPGSIYPELEKTKDEQNDFPELSESSTSQASDLCIVSEPVSVSCNTDKVQQMESQSLVGEDDSEGSDPEEVDSESVKVKRDATKRILIDKAPTILTVHLKRFSQDARGRVSKLNGHVDFGEIIDLSPYVDPRCTEGYKYKYRLVGVVEHLGTMRGGHYVAYVRGASRSKETDERENEDFVWYHASDAYVREACLEEVFRCEAYILFYEQV